MPVIRLVIAVLLISGCAADPKGPEVISDLERQVYLAVLLDFHETASLRNGLEVESFLVDRFAMAGGAVIDPDDYRTVDAYMARDFARTNKRMACLLQSDLPMGFIVRGEAACRLGETSTTRPELDEKGRHYIPSLFSFSRIGFSRDRERAVLSTAFTCGPLCGGGTTVTVKRVDGAWRVDEEYNEWVS